MQPNELARRVVQSRAGGRVERCHGLPHNGSYNNAAHSWGVAMLMLQLWPDSFPRLAAVCLAHDVPEAWTGDIPSPTIRFAPPGFKKAIAEMEVRLLEDLGLPNEHDLTGEDYAKVKACDRLELYLWCREQVDMGNRFAMEFLNELDRYLEQSVLPAAADALYRQLKITDTVARQQGVMEEICDGIR